MRQIGEPHQTGAQEATCDLSDHIARNLAPGKGAYRRQPDRHRWIDMSPADPSHRINTQCHRQTKAGRDDNPTGVLALGLPEQYVRYDAVSK